MVDAGDLARSAHRFTHLEFLREAMEAACKCEALPGAFSVGCVIVTHWPELHSPPIKLSTGYSRELPGNTHAEANALSKVDALSTADLMEVFGQQPPSTKDILKNADVYTTMEPCSVRTSGLSPCANALIEANVRRCFIGVKEPTDFVVCEGAKKMADIGIEIIWLEEVADECLAIARKGHPLQP
ncbi:hypothetical protein Clacol_006514 [Clathrus columnatus]|uniref:CMP/dCMP-type deaminase domain-containing protein n=1 Tax=Clathrus columnatus TaxID=1419009 RepID=A0AAV5AFJ2_9AGAM|nr:hypothetical protein Clacol_006514 [Clathrus columnatus]